MSCRPIDDRIRDVISGLILGVVLVGGTLGVRGCKAPRKADHLANAAIVSGDGRYWCKVYQGPDSLKIVTGSESGERLFIGVEDGGFQFHRAVDETILFPMELRPKQGKGK